MSTFTYKELWAMSDIHGYFEKMLAMLIRIGILDENCEVIDQDDVKVIFVGDYIDRGPQPLECMLMVDMLCKIGKAKAVMGNHDSWYYRKLKGADVMMNTERSETLARIKSSELYWTVPDVEVVLLDFLDNLPLWLEVDGIKFAHAIYSHSASTKPKKNQRHMMYGPITNVTLDSGYPERVAWYETYDGRHGQVVFGHYSLTNQISEFPHCVSVDCGVFKTGVLGAIELVSGCKEYV